MPLMCESNTAEVTAHWPPLHTEASAFEMERLRWAEMIDLERSEAKRRISDICAEGTHLYIASPAQSILPVTCHSYVPLAGKSKFLQIARDYERSILAECDAAVDAIAAEQRADAARADAHDRKLAEIRAKIDAARAEKNALDEIFARDSIAGRRIGVLPV
jgi:hypothetical protein